MERLLRQEVHRARQRYGVTVLMDMSTFYDTIQLNKLQDEAVKLAYPPLLLELAMQLYTGPKAILAEQEMTHSSMLNMESQRLSWLQPSSLETTTPNHTPFQLG